MSQHLFLFAHQDDETPVFWEIENLIAASQRIKICYLTSGQSDGGISAVRNKESTRALQKIGVSPTDIHFIGTDLSIPDGRLIEYIDQIHTQMSAWMGQHGPFVGVYSLAWEGGHQDHDAVYALAVKLATEANIVENSYQFPFYHGKGLKGSLFKVLNALPENGSKIKKAIPMAKRLEYFLLCISYKSQFKTWVGLGPLFLIHYIFNGNQVTQKLIPSRVFQEPHAGRVLYERRKFFSYTAFKAIIDKFFHP